MRESDFIFLALQKKTNQRKSSSPKSRTLSNHTIIYSPQLVFITRLLQKERILLFCSSAILRRAEISNTAGMRKTDRKGKANIQRVEPFIWESLISLTDDIYFSSVRLGRAAALFSDVFYWSRVLSQTGNISDGGGSNVLFLMWYHN